MSPSMWDAIVVGAGPAGSATALRLARAGRRVLLLDRARFPRDKPCSEYASPEAVRQLDALGVLAAVEAHGTTALTGSCVTGALGGGIAGRFDAAGGTPFRSTGLALPRLLLDAALVDAARASGVTVRESARVRACAQRTDGTMTVTVDGEGGDNTGTSLRASSSGPTACAARWRAPRGFVARGACAARHSSRMCRG